MSNMSMLIFLNSAFYFFFHWHKEARYKEKNIGGGVSLFICGGLVFFPDLQPSLRLLSLLSCASSI